jgi:outer membrane protein OmpA-like peptidoglycan-associated protein/tetratricopeptide (TPR) repeat protein
VLLVSGSLTAQKSACPKSQVKKAEAAFDDAAGLYKSRKYEDALKRIEKCIEADPEFADAYFLQGSVAMKRKDYKLMEESFLKAIELCPDVDPEAYFQLGWLYFDRKEWKSAEEQLKKFLEFDRVNEDHALKAERMLVKSNLYAHPVPFDPQPVRSISTADPEYLPYISPDNTMAFFTRRYEMKDKNMLVPQSVEKFMLARMQPDGTYDQGKPMEAPFNKGTSNNEGGATISIDNKHLYFTVNNKGNFDICTADFQSGQWGEIRNMGTVNDTRQWDSQPSITSDGKMLYFSSARDSMSGLDIYYSRLQDDGKWSKAVKLGPSINTNGNEKSPFIHSDRKTLYFASDSLPGLGGFDLFLVRKDSMGKWGKPVNLGYPINTESDEVGFFVSTDGKRGYFASNKINGNTGYDIYSFELYPAARPGKVYFQKGELKQGQEEAVPASIEIRNVATNQLTTVDVDSTTGEYAFVVDFENDLMISVKKEGYDFHSQYVSTKDTSNFAVKSKAITLNTLEVGGQYTINDILFSTNSDRINDTIKVVLNEFADYLKINPKIRLSLQGHTDNVGSPASNMILSEGRAKSVFDYLVSRGIDRTRMNYQGFGETRPIASNTTEDGRARNRRTVFVVTQK